VRSKLPGSELSFHVELNGVNVDALRVMEVAEQFRGWLPEVKVIVRKQIVDARVPELE
jgi:hypothetical protein